MKKLAPYVLGLALLAFVGGKNALDFYNESVYLAKTDGYTAGKTAGVAIGITRAAPKSPDPVVQAFAQSICDGTPNPAALSPDALVTTDQFTYYSEKYTARAYTCDEIRYLGSVPHPDGSSDEIYAITVGGEALWYIFMFANGLVLDIQ